MGRFGRNSGISIQTRHDGRGHRTLPGSYSSNYIAQQQRATGKRVIGTTAPNGGFPILPVEGAPGSPLP